ncbi:MAG: hypothetical protein ABIR37_00485 [Candidatus Saccharimonadales bacterium]
MLDLTEAGVVRAAETAVSLGSWVVPFCYRRECARLVENDYTEPKVRRKDEGIVRTIGDMAMIVCRRDIPVETEVIQGIAGAAGPKLHGVGYQDVFAPHEVALLEKLAPLHDPQHE